MLYYKVQNGGRPKKGVNKMKFSIVRSNFLEGLRSVQNIVAAKTTSPIMQNVRLEADNGELKMTTTDIDISILCKVECVVEEPGATTLPVKILSNMISCAAEGVIEIKVEENEKASIRAGSAKYKLSGMPEADFPRLPPEEGNFVYTLQQAVLREMLRKTSYASSQDETRKPLRGVLLSFKDGKLTAVATDGRRLALVEKEIEFPKEAEKDVILPSKTVQELQRALSSEGDVTIKIQSTQICFILPKITIYSKLVADIYPNYAQVIPSKCEQKITVDRQQLIDAIERVGVMGSEIHSTKFHFSQNLLVVSSTASDIGEANDEVPIKYMGEDIDSMYNSSYLLDALKVIDDDEVIFNLNNAHTPAVIRCSIPFLYVIMPLRVN